MDKSKQSDLSQEVLRPIEIRRGAYTELTLYDVEKGELELLSQGTPDSLYLNFAILLLSIATSFLTSLLTTVVSDRVFTVFVVITSVGFIVGTLLLTIWLRKRQSISVLVRRIKGRLPAEGIQSVIESNSD